MLTQHRQKFAGSAHAEIADSANTVCFCLLACLLVPVCIEYPAEGHHVEEEIDDSGHQNRHYVPRRYGDKRKKNIVREGGKGGEGEEEREREERERNR